MKGQGALPSQGVPTLARGGTYSGHEVLILAGGYQPWPEGVPALAGGPTLAGGGHLPWLESIDPGQGYLPMVGTPPNWLEGR